jgi:hypothetical protein
MRTHVGQDMSTIRLCPKNPSYWITNTDFQSLEDQFIMFPIGKLFSGHLFIDRRTQVAPYNLVISQAIIILNLLIEVVASFTVDLTYCHV